MTSRHYTHFAVAVYARVYEVNKMSDLSYLRETFGLMARQVRINKVYLETHRDCVVADEAAIRGARDYLEGVGVKVAGGIAVTVNERNRFQTYCYTNPEHRRKLTEVAAFTARTFDEFILDDFFFTNCKCASCIAAKGDRSWTAFRLELMTVAARELILEPARAVNPDVRITIKYPNWYEHFPGLGFNLETQPPLFDFIYTGTETRDPALGNQHLQPYGSYAVFRYFDNVKPCGRGGARGNAGGWVDPFACFTLDRYAEQLWLTLFAKAPEVTLFDFGSIQSPIRPEQRAPWQGTGTSFDFDAVVSGHRAPDGSLGPEARLTLAAGAAFETADRFLGKLGNPVGVPSYKPFHSLGEDFLHSYLGMCGIPIGMVPRFPAEAPTVLLTEAARFDPGIVARIQRQLMDGKTVVVTSGLLKALNGKGIEHIVELQTGNRTCTTQDFSIGWASPVYHSDRPVTVPRIDYLTNDSWEEVSCNAGATGTPLFHSATYANGTLHILVVPDNFGDLYLLPPEVWTRIREMVAKDLFVRLDGPAQVALFAYDNHTCIVESFRPDPVKVRLVVDDSVSALTDLVTGERLTDAEALVDGRGRPAGKKAFALTLKPHSFRAFDAVW